MQDFEFAIEDNLFQLHNDLKHGAYKHNQYTPFYIIDPKLRHIHKATVRDRVVHQAIFRKLYPIFDKSFIHNSYSCRMDKGTHRGVYRLNEYCRKVSKNYRHTVYSLKCDIRKYFSSIDQIQLLELMKRKIYDAGAIELLDLIIKSYSQPFGIGIPLGNVTSQLFANIYLNKLDQFVKHKLKIKNYIRYCDDFIIVDREEKNLLKLIPQITNFLHEQLRLELHPNKIILRKLNQGVDFLGYVILPFHRVLRTKTKKRMFKKLFQNDNEARRLSYLGVLKHADAYNLSQKVKNM